MLKHARYKNRPNSKLCVKYETIRGNDTKVRKLSGSRSCSDVRAQKFELEHDFQGAPKGGCVQEKLCFAIEIGQSSACFAPWNADQMPPTASSSRSIGANSR
jgi:hypothetical protein